MTMSNVELTGDGFIGLDYDSRNYIQPQSWPVAVDHQASQRTDASRDISPLQTSGHSFEQPVAQDPNLIVDWQFQHLQPHLQYPQDEAAAAPQFTTASYGMTIHSSPVDLMSGPHGQMSTSLLDGPYLPLAAPVDMVSYPYQDLQQDLLGFQPNGLPDMSSYTTAPQQSMIESSSPTDTYLEVRSLTSSSSDNGWSMIEPRHSHEFSFPDQVFINPTQTLHDRSLSESSYSTSYGSFVDVSNPVNSPCSETNFESAFNSPVNRRISYDHTSHGSQSPTAISPAAIVRPIQVPGKKDTSPSRSSASNSSSPPSRKPSRKSPIAAKTAETKVRKQSHNKSDSTEKKVGKRKGPLRPDQRKQASEIRKLRACLRCKFLKKTVSLPVTKQSDLSANSVYSAIRANHVRAANRHMPDYGRFLAPALTSRRLVTS